VGKQREKGGRNKVGKGQVRLSTGWRRLLRCLISYMPFRELATNYRALLRKMTYKDKASYDSNKVGKGQLNKRELSRTQQKGTVTNRGEVAYICRGKVEVEMK